MDYGYFHGFNMVTSMALIWLLPLRLYQRHMRQPRIQICWQKYLGALKNTKGK